MAFGTNVAVFVAQGNWVIKALHGVSYCHNSRLEPGTIFNNYHNSILGGLVIATQFSKLPPFRNTSNWYA